MSTVFDEQSISDLRSQRLSFKPSSYRSWFKLCHQERTIYVTGWAFVDDILLVDELLAQHIISRTDISEPFSNILLNLNGHFAVALETPDAVHLGVDLVRTIPLFYRQDGSTLMVSDDLRQIQREDDKIDPNSLIEFATAGYTTGPYTLYSSITALQSGECVSWSTTKEQQSQRYYEYACSYDATTSVEQLCEQFDEIVVAAFKRIIETLNGRQVVIPLSGGLDSRLVAATMRRLGYENLLCFSYGVPGNSESVRSQEVAKILGYRWLQIPYSADQLKKAFNSVEMREYRSFGTNGVSFPHHDDWFAIHTLRNRPEVQDDAIFMPGHTGDFICGSHLKYLFDPLWHDDPYAFHETMIKKHYSLWEDLVALDHVRATISNRLDEALGAFPNETHEDLACMYEYWEWQERQPKYIINAVRIYEFFGYAWRIPLWDRAIVDFWKRIPISFKVNKFLYLTYLTSYDPMQVYQKDAPKGVWKRERVIAQRKQNSRERLKENLRSNRLLSQPFQRYQKWRRHLNIYQTHPLGLAHVYGPFRYIFREQSKRHAKSLLLKDILRQEYGIELSDVPRKEHIF